MDLVVQRLLRLVIRFELFFADGACERVSAVAKSRTKPSSAPSASRSSESCDRPAHLGLGRTYKLRSMPLTVKQELT